MSGYRFFPFIDDPAFPHCGVNDTEGGVFVVLNLLRGNDNEIDRTGNTPHPLVDYTGDFTCVVPASLDHEEVQVTVRPGRTSRGRTEEEDLFRMRGLYNPVDDLIDPGLLGDIVFLISLRFLPGGILQACL